MSLNSEPQVERRLVIRCDASSEVGTGHFMRCLALADVWRSQGHACFFVSAKIPAGFVEMAQSKGHVLVRIEPENATQDAKVLSAYAHEGDIVLLDGYGFDAGYEAALRQSWSGLLVAIDDHAHSAHVQCDLVIDANPGGHFVDYVAPVLAGPRHALLRSGFSKARPVAPVTGAVRRLLITLGGSDPTCSTERVLEALARVPMDIQVVVAAGPLMDAARAAALRAYPRVELHQGADLMELIANADAVIAASGTSTYEILCMGRPLALLATVDNQIPVADAMVELDVAVGLNKDLEGMIGEFLSNDPLRARVAANGHALVDGLGARRVAREIRALALKARPWSEADARLVFDWNNDSESRAASFDSRPLVWKSHVQWFRAFLADPEANGWIIEDSAPVGSVRIQPDLKGRLTLGFVVGPKHRGKGYGTLIIKAGTAAFRALGHEDDVHAWVAPDNPASLQCFRSAEWMEVDALDAPYSGAVHFLLGGGAH